jgi:DNA invertase Pin-like site-specific DNA recombinase
VRIGYARVSTDDQSLNLQLDALKAVGCTRIFTDKLSGKSRKRPGLEEALSALTCGHQLVVWRLDRLGRNFRDLVDIADEMRERDTHLISLTEGIDTSSNVGEIIFRLMSVFSDFERNVIVERTRAGLAAAKARGVRLGRQSTITKQQVREARRLQQSGTSVTQIAKRLCIGRSTLYRHLQERARKQ